MSRAWRSDNGSVSDSLLNEEDKNSEKNLGSAHQTMSLENFLGKFKKGLGVRARIEEIISVKFAY